MLQKTGGTFTLSNEVDFGATAGLKSLYYKSRTTNVATVGQIRLARADVISFRNQTNGANLDLGVNSSNAITFNGVVLATGAGDVAGPGGATDNAVARFDGATGKIIQNSSGTTLSDADILTTTGIILNGLTASRLMVTDGSKNLAISAVTATEAGYLAGVTSAIQTQFSAIQTEINNVRLSRPGFIWKPADTSQLIVSGSAAAPSIIRIGSTFYTNTSDATLDLDTSGRNGVDTGSKAANTVYYLYGITPTSGTTFDLVCSITAPTTGPTGFPSWSYLGSFVTDNSSAFGAFRYSKGVYLASSGDAAQDVTTNSTSAAAKTLKIPSTATSVYGRLGFSVTATIGRDSQIGATSTSTLTRATTTSATVGQNSQVFCDIPITEASTVYMLVSNADTTTVFRALGWTEDPQKFQ